MGKKRAAAGKQVAAKTSAVAGTASGGVERCDLWVCLFLIVCIAAVYVQVRQFDFVNIDDPDSVTSNAYVRQGLTKAGLVWALTTG